MVDLGLVLVITKDGTVIIVGKKMSKYATGIYIPQHPEKYVGKGSIIYRSSWEIVFCRFCDNHPSVTQWASESISIPYRNPVTGKQSRYIPDFFVMYQDKNGQNHGELIEIKPKKEMMEHAKSQRDKLVAVINAAKWQAAQAFCAANGLKFRVVTEDSLFHKGTKR